VTKEQTATGQGNKQHTELHELMLVIGVLLLAITAKFEPGIAALGAMLVGH